MSNERLMSYTAAGILPAKVLLHPDVYRAVVEDGRIPLLHLQLNPTTRCQLRCNFCSCRLQDADVDLSIEDHKKIIDGSVASGARAVTITGGGEPTLYPEIDELMEYCFLKKLDVGLVSNAYSIDRVSVEPLGGCTWIRISVSDERGLASKPRKALESLVPKTPDVDWSFSYVVTNDIDYEKMAEVVNFANEYRFTHVRLVSDLLDLDGTPDMVDVRARLSEIVSDKLVIYQGRKEFSRGRKKCWISLLKTLIGSDGKMYPCCGTQYAEDPPAMKYSEAMCMGNALDIKKMIDAQEPFDGSRCIRCYYGNYNELLDLLLSNGLRHMNFV